ncbi:MAG: MotA/TolQ/ExbB proton channel family protein [Candidatus Eiseniibacteriota bacterium]
MSASFAASSGTRLIAVAISLLVGVVAILIMHLTLPADAIAAKILIDKKFFLYPVSCQNLQWLVFFVGLGELVVRFLETQSDRTELRQHYLPEDERTILQSADLGPIYGNVKRNPAGDRLFLPRLIKRTILQFQSNRSVDQANSLLNSSLDMCMHEIDLRYNMLRYIMWLIPSLGFLGTVIGISQALNFAGGGVNFNDPKFLSQLTDNLGTAFYTTLLALIQAAVLVFLMHVVQAREEKSLNDAGQYCLDNLINRLYER